MTENCKLRKAIISAFYNISQRNFGMITNFVMLFQAVMKFLLRSKFSLLRKWSTHGTSSFNPTITTIPLRIVRPFRTNYRLSWTKQNSKALWQIIIMANHQIIFTCLNTRAVHLEIATDCSACNGIFSDSTKILFH